MQLDRLVSFLDTPTPEDVGFLVLPAGSCRTVPKLTPCVPRPKTLSCGL
jgi:hypothetical protein